MAQVRASSTLQSSSGVHAWTLAAVWYAPRAQTHTRRASARLHALLQAQLRRLPHRNVEGGQMLGRVRFVRARVSLKRVAPFLD